ncbi:MAG: UDP-N-acetylglucosamine--N-acetylmuramyl-(pentapeptide) pyrophosphoryl-undecaprenol N-acetylglucosamine transferase [Coprothermobacterota bacterium]|nr:UDP-N-acetylglucosamine--N-acetylmuramyl-(pentapeptide) pyrophosphoryl-undecaprenol N-acetylglucosamine transferase [Coprothermobacterota bacterium]
MRVALTGGGTGGHIYPLVAVAQALRQLDPKTELLFLGQPASHEQREAARAGIPFRAFHRQDNRRSKPWHLASSLFWVGVGVAQAGALLRNFRPRFLIGAGGYVSLPAVAAASLMRTPYLLLEQNMAPGKVTRAYCRGAQAVFLTFPGSQQRLAFNDNTHVVGNPVRVDLLPPRLEARRQLGLSPDCQLVAIVGGSQGAKRLNEAVGQVAYRLLAAHPRLELFWVLGKSLLPLSPPGAVATDASLLQKRLRVADYCEEMPLWLAAADLFLGRAGSGTLSESLAAGTPMLLVPYPYAADGHQAANAAFLEEAGAAVALPEERIGELSGQVSRLLNDPKRLSAMAASAAGLSKRDAARIVAEWVQDASGDYGGRK